MKLGRSQNYDKFQMLDINRPVISTIGLEKSMKKHGWIPAYPMHVVTNGNGLFKIKDGHHRFTVAKKLGIPVIYAVCNDDASLYELVDGTKNWSIKDWMASYVNAGYNDYNIVKEYHNRTGIGINNCISMLAGDSAGSGNHLSRFKAGRYKVGDVGHAELVARIVRIYRHEMKFEWAVTASFVSAVSRIVRVDEIDIERLITKSKKHQHIIEKQRGLDNYQRMIETVYNFASRKTLPLIHLANEAAKNRSPVGKKGD